MRKDISVVEATQAVVFVMAAGADRQGCVSTPEAAAMTGQEGIQSPSKTGISSLTGFTPVFSDLFLEEHKC